MVTSIEFSIFPSDWAAVLNLIKSSIRSGHVITGAIYRILGPDTDARNMQTKQIGDFRINCLFHIFYVIYKTLVSWFHDIATWAKLQFFISFFVFHVFLFPKDIFVCLSHLPFTLVSLTHLLESIATSYY